MKSIAVGKLRPDAVMPQFTRDILKERGLADARSRRILAMDEKDVQGEVG